MSCKKCVKNETVAWPYEKPDCPRCASTDVEIIDASVDATVANYKHCNACGVDGEVYIY